jgi:hypothetical protein
MNLNRNKTSRNTPMNTYAEGLNHLLTGLSNVIETEKIVQAVPSVGSHRRIRGGDDGSGGGDQAGRFREIVGPMRMALPGRCKAALLAGMLRV